MHLPDYAGARVIGESEVEVATLDQWMDADGPARIDALKLDTQGWELDILRGAVHSLASTRHVEVEVAFNEMYEGAPLFGEVDAFLRGHGFALWRLRDLVHHGLRDALDPPRVTEHICYESSAQPVRVQGGQLIWCNAHFVRRDLYLPDCRVGWETRIRDATLMDALSFPDLTILSLKRLLDQPDCPEVVRDTAVGVLADVLALDQPDSPTGRVSSLAERATRRLRRALGRLPRLSDQ